MFTHTSRTDSEGNAIKVPTLRARKEETMDQLRQRLGKDWTIPRNAYIVRRPPKKGGNLVVLS